MLNQIITHTPVYVWAILAFLVYRGITALRTREVEMKKLFIIPVVMLALSLVDVSAKFGNGLAFATWLAAAGVTLALLFNFGAARVLPTATPGHVTVRGSIWPLLLMMAIFITKYVTSVVLAVQPQLRHDTLFTIIVCVLFGIFSGYFLGRLARDLKAFRSFEVQETTGIHAA